MELARVDFEPAKDLKELGFTLECNNYFLQALFEGKNEEWEGVFPKYSVFEHSGFHYNSSKNNNEMWYECSAPTQALVVRWFREVHRIEIHVTPYDDEITTYKAYVYFVQPDGHFHHPKDRTICSGFPTYEEAELDGIRLAINHLKRKTK